MIGDVNIEAALDYMRDHAKPLAEGKANRIYLEQFRKSKKAMLMAAYLPSGVERVTDKMRESYAYSHLEYLEILDGLKAAIEIEEEIKWKMTAAQAKVEVWRTQQANNRNIDRAHQ